MFRVRNGGGGRSDDWGSQSESDFISPVCRKLEMIHICQNIQRRVSPIEYNFMFDHA